MNTKNRKQGKDLVMRKFFSKEDFDNLRTQITSLTEEVKEAKLSVGETAAEGGSWHDNAAYDEATRRTQILSRQLQELRSLVSGAEILEPLPNDGKVRYGRTVTYEDLDTRESQTIIIGSFYATGRKPDVVSHASPIATLLIGTQAGEIRQGKIGARERRLQIIKID